MTGLLIYLIWSRKEKGDSAQLVDLKNSIVELKTKQLEAQTQSLQQQQNLLNETQKNLSNQLTGIMKVVNDSLIKSQENINTQLISTGNVVGEIQKKLGTLEQTTKNIQEIGKDISSLQDILQAPKLRGNLGEFLLEDLLKQILPAKNYETKYQFQCGTQVDAIIKLGDGIVPIDAKFPMESFQRYIKAELEADKKAQKREFIRTAKARIDEIAEKYINPDEGTFDFAMMYIPAENVFYEIIITDSLTNQEYELFNYAIQKHVIPVSPNSFYSYLIAIAYGLKGFKIEQQAKIIIGELSKIQGSFQVFYENLALMGRHLNNASKAFDKSLKDAERFNDKISQVTGVKADLLGAEAKCLPEDKQQ